MELGSMGSDTNYSADGPTDIGFQANTWHNGHYSYIRVGAAIDAGEIGIIAKCLNVDDNGHKYSGIGVQGEGIVGVKGVSNNQWDGTDGVQGFSSSKFHSGVYGRSTAEWGFGVSGFSDNGPGIWGKSGNNIGVLGSGHFRVFPVGTYIEPKAAVWGDNDVDGTGAIGSVGPFGNGKGIGVLGTCADGIGILGSSELRRHDTGSTGDADSGEGVVGRGKNGVHGWSRSPTDSGVWGENVSLGPGFGVSGSSNNGPGVQGSSLTNDGVVGIGSTINRSGVWGHNDTASPSSIGDPIGVTGSSANGTGGVFQGGRVPLRLEPNHNPTPPVQANRG